MFALKVRRTTGNVIVLPRTFATIVEAKGFNLRNGEKVAVIYAAGVRKGETAARLG